MRQDVLTEKTLQRLRDIVTGKAPEFAGEAEPEEAPAAAVPKRAHRPRQPAKS